VSPQTFSTPVPEEKVQHLPLPLLLGAENAERFRAPSYIQLGVATDFFNTRAGRKSTTFAAPVTT
jgi:hypothetical protein